MEALRVPRSWKRLGLALARAGQGLDNDVAGDPCIVWDDETGLWRMFLFYAPPGHAQAISRQNRSEGPGLWEFQGPIPFRNPEALLGGMIHKPFLALLPDGGHQAAKIDGYFQLFGISFLGTQKVIQRAFSKSLSGPWELEDNAFLTPGSDDAFDAKHVDAVTAYYFESTRELYCFYMGYPKMPQAGRKLSPLGSAQGLALLGAGQKKPEKLGAILRPSEIPGHWASGWIGGLQLFPGKSHLWLALLNASPTAPLQKDTRQFGEEPPPSLGGFAFSDSPRLNQGWHFVDQPLEAIEEIPEAAKAWGEGTNLWRHYLLRLDNGRQVLYYNSGSYGQEQLYAKEAVD